MKKPDDALLDRLLGQDQGLSATEEDAIFETVLARTAAAPQKRRWIWAMPLVAAASVAAMVLMLDSGDFTARGKGQSNLRVACHVKGGEPADSLCAPGEQLYFEVEGQPFFAAFIKLPDGTASWVVENSLHVGTERRWLPLTAEVEAQVGTHTVYGVFTKTALTKDEVRALVEKNAGEVVTRTIEVRK